MATLTYQTLQFREQEDALKVVFLRSYYFLISHDELHALGTYSITEDSITFPELNEKKLQHKFNILIEKGFQNLIGVYTRKKTFYIHRNAGVPLIGTRFIGIQDRGSNFLEVKPITGCTMGCTFCSVDEGIGSKKGYDFFVEREYLVEETKKLLDFKKCSNIHIYINVHGEPLLYPEIVELVADLKAIEWVKEITIITTAALLTEAMIDQLAKAGLTELNVSISAMDAEAAKKIMGNPAYNITHVKKLVLYAAKKMHVTIAPVWVDAVNDEEMEKIIAFGKEIQCPVRIQKFCHNKFGRNPVEEISWEDFFKKIEELEKKTGVKLKEDVENYTLETTKEYPVPFTRRENVEAPIIGPGRYFHEKLCVARDRLISVPMCRKQSGTVKIRILKTTNNIIVGEEV
ncbi:radical SAM protein [Candidatus Woesearchaeota archaeon]|nr:radical SAM protein [Candidatus Woesearchaeota archaeon]